jgi:hypothetical protein
MFTRLYVTSLRRENKVNQVITARANKDLCTLQDVRYYGNPSFAIDRRWYQEKFLLWVFRVMPYVEVLLRMLFENYFTSTALPRDM